MEEKHESQENQSNADRLDLHIEHRNHTYIEPFNQPINDVIEQMSKIEGYPAGNIEIDRLPKWARIFWFIMGIFFLLTVIFIIVCELFL